MTLIFWSCLIYFFLFPRIHFCGNYNRWRNYIFECSKLYIALDLGETDINELQSSGLGRRSVLYLVISSGRSHPTVVVGKGSSTATLCCAGRTGSNGWWSKDSVRFLCFMRAILSLAFVSYNVIKYDVEFWNDTASLQTYGNIFCFTS